MANKNSRRNEHIILSVFILLFATLLIFIEPSYTAYTSKNMIVGSYLPFISLILIATGIYILYKKIF
ncbi:MAG: hypothetical protein AABX29_08330 [Nanoarchaeota archaeon]